MSKPYKTNRKGLASDNYLYEDFEFVSHEIHRIVPRIRGMIDKLRESTSVRQSQDYIGQLQFLVHKYYLLLNAWKKNSPDPPPPLVDQEKYDELFTLYLVTKSLFEAERTLDACIHSPNPIQFSINFNEFVENVMKPNIADPERNYW